MEKEGVIRIVGERERKWREENGSQEIIFPNSSGDTNVGL
jgi:hypothetical protein